MKGEGRYIFRVEWKSQDEQEWHHVTDVPLELIFEAEETGQ